MTIIFELARRFAPQLILGIAILSVLAGVYFWGSSNGSARTSAHYQAIIAERDRAAAQALAQALEDERANARAAMDAERKQIEAKAKTEQQFEIITKTVTQYVEQTPSLSACVADPVFVRLWNSANRGSASSDDTSAR